MWRLRRCRKYRASRLAAEQSNAAKGARRRTESALLRGAKRSPQQTAARRDDFGEFLWQPIFFSAPRSVIKQHSTRLFRHVAAHDRLS